LFSTGWFQ